MHRAIVYHTISAPEKPLPANIDISPERFETHLQWLSKRRKQVASLREFLTASEKENLIAITFDDGFRDNLTFALPLLEKYELPMTLFVAAGFIGKENYLSAEDIQTLVSHPLITIGSHGFWHRHLTKLSEEEVRFELSESKKLLEEITNKEIDLLAYPYGDCNGKVERLSEECGYTAAWSVWNGKNTPFSRWRVPLGRNDNLLRFIAKVSPFYFPVKKILKPPVIEAGEEKNRTEFLPEGEALSFK
ncbi:MAG TPA: polysaccharide deacetylase family protein [Pyrinomonadaceae bacterium]|nr:polysaccharide deacetylase family protein [Pyrinomonadaceae bacterium]